MQVHLAQVNANMSHFLVSYAVAFIAFGLIAKWYVWPNIRERSPKSRSRRCCSTHAFGSTA